MHDKVTSAEDLSERGERPSASARPSRSGWAADDILPTLTRRVAELEERLAAMQADLEAERGRLATYAESDRTLNEAAADSYRRADAILQRARAEANETLSGAVDERHMLLNEVERLREEREGLHDEIASLRSGGPAAVSQAVQAAETPPAFDLQTAVAEEMRTLLVEILADFRSRVAAPPAVEHISVQPAIVADVVNHPPEPILDTIVEDVETAVPQDDLTDQAAPIDKVELIVEHVDELIRP